MRLSLSLVFVILISCLCSTGGIAAEKMHIAVLDLQPKGVTKVIAGGITDMIRADLVDVGIFSVVERGQMNEIMKEQGFQMTGCTDQECAVQVGKLLSAKKILIGEATKIGKSIVITVRIVDVEKGVAEFAAKETAANEDALEAASRSLSKKLIERISGKTMAELLTEREPRTQTGYYLRSIVPGWGQFYAGKAWKGYAFSGAFIAAAAFSTYAVLDYRKKKSDYDGLPYGTLQTEFDSKYDAYKKAGPIALYSLGIVGIVYLANWVDVIFLTKPAFDVYKDAGLRKGDVYVNLYSDAGSGMLPERRTTLVLTMRF